MILACVPVYNDFTSDNRVRRTCRFLIKNGFEVHVLAAGRSQAPEHEVSDGINVHRFRPDGPSAVRRGAAQEIRRLSTYWLESAAWVRKHRPAVIHYNDWNTLFIGPLANVGHRSIYDMHELFQDLDYLNFPKPINRTIAAICRQGLRRAEAVICVSQPIQAELRTLTRRPVHVVRNIPEWHVAQDLEDPALVKHFSDGRKHLVYFGGLQEKRGALYMLEVLEQLPQEFVLDCFSGKNERNAFFSEQAELRGLSSRVQMFDYVPQAELIASVGRAFAGLSILVPSSRKLDYALPNKLFEYLHAGLPVISANTRAQAALIADSGLGLVVDLDDPRGAALSIASWERPPVTMAALDANGLTWAHEERVLHGIYEQLGII